MPQAEGAPAAALTDPQKLQLVVGNFVQKTAELILHARLIPLPDALRPGTVNRWFNVESEELVAVHDELEAWRQDTSQPLQLDIFVDVADNPLLNAALGVQVCLADGQYCAARAAFL